MEELRLTTFFFEELLILGTPENVKQIRDKLQTEVEDLNNELRKRQFRVDQANARLKNLDSMIFSSNPSLKKELQKLEVVKSLYDAINKRQGKQMNILEENDGVFGQTVQQAFQKYKEAKTKLDNWRNSNVPRAQLKNTLDLFSNLLNKALKDEEDIRWNTWKKQQSLVDRLQDQADSQSKGLKKEKKDAEKSLTKAQNSLNEIQKQLTRKEAELERAENELAWVIQNQEDTIKPKLMIIVEAEISGYVNLKDLKINRRQFDDTLEVYVPMAQLDSVIVRVDDDSTRLYQLAKAGREDVSNEGAYYDIFQQLKNAIIQAEGRVKKRALKAGIMAETRKLAKDYVRQFAGNLNLAIRFRDSIPNAVKLPPPPPPPGQEDDSLPPALLDTNENP